MADTATDPLLAVGFDHPCKGSCSGWAQGRERGLFERNDEVTKLKSRYQDCQKDLAELDEQYGRIMDDNKRLRETLERIMNAHATNPEMIRGIAAEALKEQGR